MKPTPEEKRNHWGSDALAAYIAERNQAAADAIFGDPNVKRDVKVENMRGYHPHRFIKNGG